MKKNIRYILIRLTLFLTPIVLLFTTKIKLTEKERLQFFLEGFFKLTPIVFITNYFFNWHGSNETFLQSLYFILLFNAIIGIATHRKLKTTDIGEFFKSTLITVLVVFGVYFSLERMSYSVKNYELLNVAFLSSIQVMTMLFPISKIARNSFILTNGGFPPKFFIENLYNYERDGNIQKFLSIIKKEK